MSEPVTPSAMVEALEKRAAAQRAHAKYVSENRDDWFCTTPGGYEERELREAAELEAAAAFIRSTMEAVEPFVRCADDMLIDRFGVSDPIAFETVGGKASVKYSDFARLRALTGAPDER